MRKLRYCKGIDKEMRAWPEAVKETIIFELRAIQSGRQHGFSTVGDWVSGKPKKHLSTEVKSMREFGRYAMQLSVKWKASYRVIYVAKYDEAIYVLHCFIKDREGRQKKDYQTAKQRYKSLELERRDAGHT